MTSGAGYLALTFVVAGIADRRAVKLSTNSRRRDFATHNRRDSSSRPKPNPPRTVLLAIPFFHFPIRTSTPSARRSLSDDAAVGGADAVSQSRRHDGPSARKENGSSSTTTEDASTFATGASRVVNEGGRQRANASRRRQA
ncbi:hypothetical protein EXIGLDRAFT_834346 [Exidia glandulosa HHB12029]|uniref:Uncharacterized protein n=1 Tax=Exidia glandulosa HHB12029 TaxID=1314781 RepID=A0A165JWH5_EXIGL|nr:hypothetical protein EXIGLDRAFT_834346 [Exidia glandulosa HHB12029]